MAEARPAELTIPRVAAALVIILVLAIAVPYAAVRRLHEGRIAAADREAQSLAERVRPLVARQDLARAGVVLLTGAGNQPRTNDERWTAAIPLSSVSRNTTAEADPWGNAFLVIATGSPASGAAWVLSAGPDGVIQTPFPSPSLTAAGDDRVVAIR